MAIHAFQKTVVCFAQPRRPCFHLEVLRNPPLRKLDIVDIQGNLISVQISLERSSTTSLTGN